MSFCTRFDKCRGAAKSFLVNHKQGLVVLTPMLLGVVTIITPMMLVGNKTVGDVSNEPHVGFRGSPSTRGTMSIVWMCITTVFSCVYVSLHCDIPTNIFYYSNYADSTAFKRTYEYLTWFMSERGYVLIVGFLSPGLFLAQAFDEYYYSTVGLSIMRKLCFKNWKIGQCFFAEMGGFLADDFDRESGDSLAFYEWVWKKRQIGGKISLSLNHIKEKSGSNALVKVIASLQIGWVLIQVIIRHVQFLPVSLLELVTCAYIVCAVPTLFLWMNKPYDIREYYDFGVLTANSIGPTTYCTYESVEKEIRSCK